VALKKYIFEEDLADTLKDEIRGIDLDPGASGKNMCTLLW
jgi:hypothetical protein